MRVLKLGFTLIVLFTGLMLPISAQEEEDTLSYPSYATPLNLTAKPIPGVTVNLVWASADESRVQVAWEYDFDLNNLSAYVTSASIQIYNASGILLEETTGVAQYLSEESVSPFSGQKSVYFAHPNLMQGRLESSRETTFTAIVMLAIPITPNNPDERQVIPVPFTFAIPVTEARRWEGEGHTLTLKQVEWSASATILEMCFPYLPEQSSSFYQGYYRPHFVSNPEFSLFTLLEREGLPPLDGFIQPEATAEPSPAPTPESIPAPNTPICGSFTVGGLTPTEDGVLEIVVNHLRLSNFATEDEIPLINDALNQAGVQAMVFWDEANGLGILPLPGSEDVSQVDMFKVFYTIEDITAERILGPWVFEATLE
ncbi:MAG: hypothetical protein MUF38_11045 [Anaerolineae bacterium]|nr:hypothetical protein [Anaerolineae bacterium]